MMVVNSAGNDGGNGWRYVGVPADADSIITVGAVDSLRQHAGFSSYGPTADGRIKPTLGRDGRGLGRCSRRPGRWCAATALPTPAPSWRAWWRLLAGQPYASAPSR
ncbi:MAG: S8 family serine peptidase [Hymenobacter sp.]